MKLETKDWFDFLAIFIMLAVGWGLREYYVGYGIALISGMAILYKYEEIRDRQ